MHKYLFSTGSRALLLTTALMLIMHPSYAGISDSLKNELQKVSRVMYEQLNSKFVIVDAILDGQIKLKSPYTFIYEHDNITINDTELPEEIKGIYVNKLKYIERLKNLRSDARDIVSSRVSFYSKGTDLREIFDVDSDFRKPNSGAQTKSPLFYESLRSITNVFSNDGLLDTAAQYTIRYNTLGLFINNVEVPKDVAARYVKLINANGFTVRTAEDQLYIDREQITCSNSSK